ncbi:MAG: hypothetical protein AAF497_01995, partial [Planctomycetota bacterium]
MSILINKDTKVICQGITGRAGEFHSSKCIEYGTQLTDAVLSSDETSWMCAVDDDVFVNWAVLRPLLLEELSSDTS